ncbi:MAG: bifunctional folylpolyglutamate synthase/dihydrofolate synthase [Planctomycetota bacterium]|jgi:dihydrofolate synthase/folylpolyglutamate synthase
MHFSFENLAQVEKHLAETTDYEKMARFAYHERAFNLDRTRRLLAALSDPQERFEVVHVAGTKGKGSVCHMISSVWTAAGVPTGLFTSPHLVSMPERIRVGDRPVSEPVFCRGMERVARAAVDSAVEGEETPTFFERVFALACLLFTEAGVERAAVEVGLGGRLDATNVLAPRVTVITTLALDHTHVLGNTLSKIAFEKAGILKPGVVAVCAGAEPEAEAVLLAAAAEASAPLVRAGRELRWETRPRTDGGFGIEVDVETEARRYEGLRIPLAGLHQGGNAALAVGALERFEGEALDPGVLREGLGRVFVPGRLQKVRENPPVFIDVAHNEAAVRATLDALENLHPGRRLRIVAGFSKDKDYRSALAPLAARAAQLLLTSSGGNRSADPLALRDAVEDRYRSKAEPVPAFEEAVDVLLRTTEPEDLALVTGSFYVVGRAMRHLGVAVR